MMMVSQGLTVDDHSVDNYSSFTVFRKKASAFGNFFQRLSYAKAALSYVNKFIRRSDV